MYLTEEFESKKKTKSARKFENQNIIPRFKTASFLKSRKSNIMEHLEHDLGNKLEENERKQILEDYQNNPYFRKKIDLIVENILSQNHQPQPATCDEHLEVENMQTLNSKKRQIRKSQKVKCEELRRQIEKIQ